MWRKLSPGVYVDGRCVKPGAWEYGKKQPGARWVPDAPVYKPAKWKPEYKSPPPVDKAALALAIAALAGRDGPIPGFEYKIAMFSKRELTAIGIPVQHHHVFVQKDQWYDSISARAYFQRDRLH